MLIGIAFLILGLIVGQILKRKMKRYSQVKLKSNLSGKEVAEMMLSAHKIYDVRISCVPGRLTDHYNPIHKSINLSPDVYEGRSVAAAAVAAHECGHAVQHATAYAMLELRSKLVPLQNVSARVLNAIFMMMLFGGFLLPQLIPFQTALLVIIAAYSVFTLFAFITLPVEFDASRRALSWIRTQGVVDSEERKMAGDALKAAAMTYVVAAIGALSMLLYYVMMYVGNRE